MDEVTRKLQLIFMNGDGGQSIVSPKFFTDSFVEDADKVKEWMDKFSELGVFYHQEKNMPMYTGRKNARIIETKTINIF